MWTHAPYAAWCRGVGRIFRSFVRVEAERFSILNVGTGECCVGTSSARGIGIVHWAMARE